MNKPLIYLDHCATTRVCPQAVNAAVQAMETEFGNPASLHFMGYQAEKLFRSAQETLAKGLDCMPEEVYFTSGATESNNLAIRGGLTARRRQRNKIITTAIEHASVMELTKQLAQEGYQVEYISPNADGRFDPMDFYRAVDDKTALVSAMLVNNETGLRLPVEEIARAVKKKDPEVLVHVDGVQGFLKIPFSFRKSGIDLFSASGHKVYAPKGVGLLAVKKGVRLVPLLYGGHQQKNLRVGTEAMPQIAAFAAAANWLMETAPAHLEHYKQLNACLRDGLGRLDGITFHSDENCVPYILNFSVKDIRSEVNLHFLEQYGICVSSGSACAKGAKSHVLKALGKTDREADTALRIGLGPENTREEMEELVRRVEEGMGRLAKLR